MADKITKNNQLNYKKKTNVKSMFIEPTNENEVIKIIKTLNIEKAPAALDNITVLKQAVEVITPPLTTLINKIIESGTCPTTCKTAVTKALYKSGDKKFRENYRPISLTSNGANVFENVVHTRLTNFISK